VVKALHVAAWGSAPVHRGRGRVTRRPPWRDQQTPVACTARRANAAVMHDDHVLRWSHPVVPLPSSSCLVVSAMLANHGPDARFIACGGIDSTSCVCSVLTSVIGSLSPAANIHVPRWPSPGSELTASCARDRGTPLETQADTSSEICRTKAPAGPLRECGFAGTYRRWCDRVAPVRARVARSGTAMWLLPAHAIMPSRRSRRRFQRTSPTVRRPDRPLLR
jgi:hypothetical protein